MKILEVVPYLSTASLAAGQNEIIYQTAMGLAGRGHQVSVYTSDEQLHHDMVRQLGGQGVTVRLFRVILKAATFFRMPGMILSAGRRSGGARVQESRRLDVWYCPLTPKDPRGIEKAMLTLKEDSTLAKSFRSRGGSFFEEPVDPEVVVEAYWAVFKAISMDENVFRSYSDD